MPTNNRKKQNVSSRASSIPSQGTSTGESTSPASVNGDELLSRLATVARELHGQSTGIVERLCQTIIEASQGQVRLVLLPNKSQPTQTTSSIEDLWLSLPVEYAGRSYGQLAVAPHPTQQGQPALPYQYMQLLASYCGLLLYSLETAAYFQRECPPPVKLTEDLTQREQKILELMCQGFSRKQIGTLLNIEKGTIAKMCGTIYTKLGGVRTERHAIAAAFMLGLSFPIQNLSATFKSPPTNGIHSSS